MADLTDEQIAWLTSELGDGLDTADLQARFDRLGTIRDVAIEVWRTRRTKLLRSPLAVNLSGVASVDYKANVAAMTLRIEALSAAPDDDPSDDGDGGPGPMRVVGLVRTRGR